MKTQRSLIKIRIPVLHETDDAQLAPVKSLYMRCIRFIAEPGTADGAVHSNEDAVFSGFRTGCQPDGFPQVKRPVGTDRRSRTHGSGNNDRLVRMDGKIQEIGRLFKCIRTVRNDDSVHIGTGGDFFRAAGQGKPHPFSHVRTVHIGKLLPFNRRLLSQSRQGLQELADSHRPRPVAGQIRRGTGLTRYGPAAGNYINLTHNHTSRYKVKYTERNFPCL